MLVLGALGVPQDHIVADYALTAARMIHARAWYTAHFPEQSALYADVPSAFLAALPAAMARVIDDLCAEHGSVRALPSPRSACAAATLDQLADGLLEDPANVGSAAVTGTVALQGGGPFTANDELDRRLLAAAGADRVVDPADRRRLRAPRAARRRGDDVGRAAGDRGRGADGDAPGRGQRRRRRGRGGRGPGRLPGRRPAPAPALGPQGHAAVGGDRRGRRGRRPGRRRRRQRRRAVRPDDRPARRGVHPRPRPGAAASPWSPRPRRGPRSGCTARWSWPTRRWRRLASGTALVRDGDGTWERVGDPRGPRRAAVRRRRRLREALSSR